ncbi:hypothetical protein Y882_13095 [Dyella japonica DSM 16301]|uniref:Uncharacterized protein n=1 Tax=Dyella japonica DSM 16301 TaxID=1440762 RepID=A0A0G9H0R5_9GAMM|nr:hypothetical protein Y882_13095 [Dyella japonica DSM 16301]
MAAASSVAPPPVTSSSYFVAASELPHPLRPFEHLPGNAAINVHAAVVTMPDPVETRLGRSFDTELTALVSAFQAKEYVLDGFAFTWAPRAPDDKPAPNEADASRRSLPSVMLFRKDNWRSCKSKTDKQADAAACESTYYVLFLVGETPSFGIHPESFIRAARCAMALDASNRQQKNSLPDAFNQTDCDRIAWKAPINGVSWSCDANLAVIGPTFSGAMESMASALSKVATEARDQAIKSAAATAKATNQASGNAALETTGAACQGPGHLNIVLRTPSASVDSNDQIVQNAYLSPLQPFVSLNYTPLAYSVGHQLERVKRYLERRILRGDKVVILSEESSFGLGASKLAMPSSSSSSAPPALPASTASSPASSSSTATARRVQFISVQFPPNIAAIRSEHVQLKQEESKQRRSMLPERLLELDLTGVERGVDQPPTYQPSLSSRSDELMLYQTFDALQRFVTPAAVIIVATDVRDRLFLLSEIRNAFPGALPVVLEQDNLMVHPDYRAMSRGSIIMPAGKSLLCLNASGLDCFPAKAAPDASPREQASPSSAGNAPELVANHCTRAASRRFFSFPTDYAANMFRAVVGLICPSDASPNEPAMLVATLAGFQRVDESVPDQRDEQDKRGAQRNSKTMGDIPIVADTRMQLQQPVYLSMGIVLGILLVTAVWLVRNGRTPELATLPLSRHAMRWMDMVKTPNGARASRQAGEPRTSWWWLAPWIAFAVFGIVVAACKIIVMFPPATPGDTDLAHGTDRWALICLCLAYACFVAFCGVRMRVWNAYCLAIAEHVDASSRLKVRLYHRAYLRASVATVLLLLVLVLCVNDYLPTGAHSVWLSAFAGAFVLGSSGFFLVLYLEGLDRWRCMSLELSRTVTAVQESTGVKEWPTPKLLDERPRSPFNVVMRIDNYNALRRPDLAAWVRQTNALLGGTVDPSFDKAKLREWQAVLVSQMKLAGTAVRSSAWCAVLGATVTLMLIQVYPPVYERLQTTAAAILMLLGFAAITYGVLTLEKDYLLGRMFTNDKDQLTLGGALSALWPKLLAMGSILITVFLPDAWDWLNSAVKAVNSLR